MFMLKRLLNDAKVLAIRMWHDESGNIKKMFTPPKSKSPWEAMTSGSTGGWAKFASPTEGGWVGKAIGPALTAAAGMVPGVGPFLSSAMGAAGMSGVGGFQGTDSGLGKGIMDTIGGGLAGWGVGGLGKGIQSGISGAMGGQAGSSMLGNFGTGFKSGLSQYGATTAAPFKKVGSYFGSLSPAASGAASGGTSGALSNALTTSYLTGTPGAPTTAGVGSMLSGQLPTGVASAMGMDAAGAGMLGAGANAMINSTAAQAPKGLDFGSRMVSFIKDPTNLAGLAMMGGSAMIPGAEAPDTFMPSYMGELTSKLLGEGAISDLAKQGRGQLSDAMMKEGAYKTDLPTDEYYQAATRKIDEAYDEAMENMKRQYKRYGAEDSQDFNMAVQGIEQDRAREKAALQAETIERRYVQDTNRAYDAVKTSLNVDDKVMADLLGLAGMSMEEAAMMYGAEVADVQSLREMLGMGGAALLQSGQNKDMLNMMFGNMIT
jgi:hypothetical protein